MKKIALVVDDEPMIRLMLSEMLSLVNFTVTQAEDGIEAMQKIMETRPDVIILDVMMPNMDGISVCKQLRHQPETADLPIIIVSGKAQMNDIEEGLEAGADRYLRKPVALAEFLQNVREIATGPSV
jgi:CheY-like chemotaxis protein